MWNARLGRPYWAADAAGRCATACGACVRRAASRARPRRATQRSWRSSPASASLFLENFAVFPERLQRQLLLAPEPARSPTIRTPRRLRCYDGRRGGHARPDEPRRSADLSARAADEAGPDEHGGVDREPRAVPRRRARRARRGAAGRVQAARLADQGRAARGGAATSSRRRSSRGRRWDFRCRSAAGCATRFWPVVEEFVLGPRAQAAGSSTARRCASWPTSTAPGGARTPSGCGCSSTSKSGSASSARARRPPTSCASIRRVTSYMRILWVKMGGLWPPTTGGRVRSLQIAVGAVPAHQVTLVTTHGPMTIPTGLARQLPRCQRVDLDPVQRARSAARGVSRSRWRARGCRAVSRGSLEVARRRRCATRSAALIADGDVDVSSPTSCLPRSNVPSAAECRSVLFEHNVEYLIWKRLSDIERRPWRRALLEIEWRKLRRAKPTPAAAPT